MTIKLASALQLTTSPEIKEFIFMIFKIIKINLNDFGLNLNDIFLLKHSLRLSNIRFVKTQKVSIWFALVKD